MSFVTLERAVLAEARELLSNPKLRQKDLLAWSTGPVNIESDDEKIVHLPGLSINVIILASCDKRKASSDAR